MTPLKALPEVSPATYLEARQRDYEQAVANVEMTQAPQPELPQHYVESPIYHLAP